MRALDAWGQQSALAELAAEISHWSKVKADAKGRWHDARISAVDDSTNEAHIAIELAKKETDRCDIHLAKCKSWVSILQTLQRATP